MPWPEDIASDLPDPHPEEPAQLRSDILDELYDHLQSSLEHEQLTEANQDAAKKSVLSRFGNPATIACRLWWDAMWGRIMLQRITLGFVILLCLCSVVATAFVWQAMQQGQQVTVALLAEVKALREQAIAPEDERMKYLDWVPLTVKLDYEGGEPVVDSEFKVQIEGDNLYGGSAVRIDEHPDQNGLIDIGLVKPGRLSIYIISPWGESMGESFLVKPGAPSQKVITCPRQEARETQVEFRMAWPDGIQNRDLWYYFTFERADRQLGQQSWSRGKQLTTSSLLIDPDGKIYDTEVWVSAESPKPLDESPITLSRQRDSLAYILGQVKGYTSEGIRQHKLREFNDLYECRLDASFDQVIDKVSWPENGVRVRRLMILIREQEPLDDHDPKLRPLVHLAPGQRPFAAPNKAIVSPDWTYHPSDLAVEIIRKRLGVFDQQQKTTEETTRASGR